MKKPINRLVLFVSLVAILALTSCVPSTLGLLNSVGRATDGTTLEIYQEGIVFTPVSVKTDLVLSVIGDTLAEDDPNCTVKTDGVVCIVDEVTATTRFNVTGSNLAAWASWFEGNDLIAKFLVAK